jgi:flagellar hook-length control protein FliK
MLDLLTINALSPGQKTIAPQSKLSDRSDQLFAKSLRTQKQSNQPDATDQNTLDPSQSSDPNANAPQVDTDNLPEPSASNRDESDITDPQDAASNASDQDDEVQPDAASQEQSQNADASNASTTDDNNLPDDATNPAIQLVAMQDHLASLSQLAQTARQSQQASLDPSLESESKPTTTNQSAPQLKSAPTTTKPAAQETSPESAKANSTPDKSDTQHAEQAAAAGQRPAQTQPVRVETNESTTPQAQIAKVDPALTSAFNDSASNESNANAGQQGDSRLLKELKQKPAQSSANTAKQVDPFALNDPFPKTSPVAIVKPTIAPQTSPIQLQAVDPGTQTNAQSAPTEDRGNLTALTRGLAAAVRQRGGAITIKLSPETLGPIRISMEIQHGVVKVQFEAASDQARDLLQRNMDSLRATLQSKGFGVERLTVQTTPGSFDNTSRDPSNQSQQNKHAPSQNHDASDGQSRGHREQDSDDQPHNQNNQEFNQHWRLAVNTTA